MMWANLRAKTGQGNCYSSSCLITGVSQHSTQDRIIGQDGQDAASMCFKLSSFVLWSNRIEYMYTFGWTHCSFFVNFMMASVWDACSKEAR